MGYWKDVINIHSIYPHNFSKWVRPRFLLTLELMENIERALERMELLVAERRH
jgi:hypothetical protein